MVTLLVGRGADFTIQEDLYHGTPAGWAEYAGSDAIWDYLRSLQAASGG
jgi:hypothetical protein